MKWYRQMVTHTDFSKYIRTIYELYGWFFFGLLFHGWAMNSEHTYQYVEYSFTQRMIFMMPLWFSANKCTGFYDVFGWHVYGTEIYAKFYPHT